MSIACFRHRSWTSWRHLSSIVRSTSTSSSGDPVPIFDKKADPQFRQFDLPNVTEPEPIKAILAVNKVRLVYKEGSFIRNLFLGEFDKDYLAYPEVLRSRHEYKQLMKQQEVINKYFKGLIMRDPGRNLPTFGFNHLWFLSKTEMINILETVGHALGSEMYSPIEKTEVDKFRAMIQVIMNNVALSFVRASENGPLKQKIMEELNQNPALKIGFAWNEDCETPSSTYSDWKTHAVMSQDSKYWVVSGEKCGILADNYDYYLVFCKTKDYPHSRRPEYLLTQTIPYDGVVSLLLPRHVFSEMTEYVENGMMFQRIKLEDVLLPIEDFEIAPAEVDGVRAYNYKSLAQLCITALMVGHMRLQLEELYGFLIKDRFPLTETELIGTELANLTQDLYAVESALYFTTAMFDMLEVKGNPEISLEGALTKVMAFRASQKFADVLSKISGSSFTTFAPLNDWIYRCDNFLGDNFSEMFRVALAGMDFAEERKGKFRSLLVISPHANGRLTNTAMRSYKRQRVMTDHFVAKWDLQGYVHPSLSRDAELLEQLVRCLEYCAEIYMTRFPNLDSTRERDLLILSDIALKIFTITCVLGRASRSYCETLRNAHIDVEMTHMMLYRIRREIHELLEELETHDLISRLIPFKSHADKTMEMHRARFADPLDYWTKDPPPDPN